MKKCAHCGDIPTDRLRLGLCDACYRYKRRTGRARPTGLVQPHPTVTAEAPSRECSTCRKFKTLEEFGSKSLFRSPKTQSCLACRQHKKELRRLVWQNTQTLEERVQASRERKVSSLRTRVSKYGLSVDQYERMVEEQGNRCAICRRPPPLGELLIDHHHGTGAVRGLLCHACNVGIGWLQDDPAVIATAAEYVATGGKVGHGAHGH